jgi:imidazolonepropionase-like amidohydrolase
MLKSLGRAAASSLVIAWAACTQVEGPRPIAFETTEATQANVAVSPDGERLVFTILGHLFQVPVEGGVAEQLTFGPYYDTDPTFAPGGRYVAFVSDRDESEGNVFVLDLETAEIRQLTNDSWSARPAWSPDGETIAYLSYWRRTDEATPPTHAKAVVRTIDFVTGKSRSVTKQAEMVSSVFYLPTGRLAWTVFEGRDPDTIYGAASVPDAVTRVQVVDEDGVTSTVRTIQGIAHRCLASPAGDGLYCRRIVAARMGGWFPEEEEVLFVSLGEGAVERLASVSGTTGWDWGPRFDVAGDGEVLYVGEGGGLRAIPLSGMPARPIAFDADVRLDVFPPTAPSAAAFVEAGGFGPPRTVHRPTVSPDNRDLVFGAAGMIWRQPLSGGPAEVIYRGQGFARDPVLSPDGRFLALVESSEIKVLDLESGRSRSLSPGRFHWQVTWGPDGDELIDVDGQRIVSVNVRDGTERVVTEIGGPWVVSRPQFSADRRAVYFSDAGTVYRLTLDQRATPEPLTDLTGSLGNAVVSHDGEWLVFSRRREIWSAPLDSVPIGESDAGKVSALGGWSFSLVPGSTTVVYSIGNQVWRQPLEGGDPEQVSLEAELKRPEVAPVLLRDVRLLDFESGGFGSRTSMLIEGGRISRVGADEERSLPEDVVLLDGGGRFAIPGLFDLHVHSSGASYRPFVAYGVTSLRDVSRGLVWVGAWADRSDVTSKPIPRHFYAGEPVWGAPGFLSEEDARAAVREQGAGGAGLIKAYATSSWPLQRATADEARRLGLPVVAHGMSLVEIVKGVTLGYAMLEHSGFRVYDDVLQMLTAAGTSWDPTIGATLGYPQLLVEKPEWPGYERLRSFFPDVDEQIEAFRSHDWKTSRLPVILPQQLESVRSAHRLGVTLHAGTDAPDPDHLSFSGLALHWELEHLTRAGISPLEALRIATQQAAVAVGAADDLGTLEVGKLGDVVLLDENPLTDIRNTQTIWRVIKGGWVFDPDDLSLEP